MPSMGRTETTGRGGARNRLVLLAALAAAGIAAVVGMLSTGRSPAEAQSPAGVYAGSLTVVEAGVCGGGSVLIGLDTSGTAVEGLAIGGATFGGVAVSTDVLSFDPTLPLAADDSFAGDFQPLPSTTAHIQGTFDHNTVTGTVGIASLDCDVPFTAERINGALPNATYTGQVSSDGVCGGGTISVTTGSSQDISSIVIEGVNADGTAVSASATFDPGTVSLGTQLPDTFTVYFDDATGAYEITVSGTFVGEELSGELTISPSTCGAIPFSATAPIAITLTPQVIGLPADGGGRPDDTSGAALWAVFAGAAGLVALGAALVARRRGAG